MSLGAFSWISRHLNRLHLVGMGIDTFILPTSYQSDILASRSVYSFFNIYSVLSVVPYLSLSYLLSQRFP
jgi:hypothetical protein